MIIEIVDYYTREVLVNALGSVTARAICNHRNYLVQRKSLCTDTVKWFVFQQKIKPAAATS